MNALLLTAALAFAPAAAGPAAALPVTPSPAAMALAEGRLHKALDLPAEDAAEARWIRAQVALAEGRVAEARSLTAELPEDDTRGMELRWRIARADGAAKEIATTAAAYCQAGDPTGRACADAELFAGATGSRSLAISGEVELVMAKGAPMPIALGTAGGEEGAWIIDTGASETVISEGLARRLGLKVTGAAFPVGVAGGGQVVLARLAILPRLDLGSARVEGLPVLVMDLSELEDQGIHGILSPQQALAGAEVHLDFPRSRLRLRRGGRTPEAGGVTVPYFAAGEDLAVLARVGEGPQALFGLDTGMQGACAVAADYRSGLKSRGRTRVQGAGAGFEAERLADAAVTLGPESLGAGSCIRSPMHKRGIRLAGLLGNALWADGSVTLDTVRRTITVRK